MARTIVIKVGTSTLTGRDGGIDRGYVRDLAGEIASLVHEGRRAVLVSSGAIRAGCDRLGWTQRPRTVPMKQAAAAVGQGELMELYAVAFGRHGLPVGQLLLTRHDAVDRTRYLNARNTLSTLLRHGVVPIVNENDTVAVEEIRFGDNDTLAAQVAALAHAELLILLTDVEGLLDRHGAVIPQVREIDPAVRSLCAGAGAVGSGGMSAKLAAAEIACAAGIRTVVARGRPAATLRKILSGEPCGTEFLPFRRRLAGRKHWIAYGSASAGALAIHPLAEAALVSGQKSLLPAGVVAVEGEFARGEIVSLVGEGGGIFARGIVNCGAREARQVMGLHTAEARRRIGSSTFQEVIHRDNLVLLPPYASGTSVGPDGPRGPTAAG
jgi:glutamate 5-kinase